MLEDLIGFNGQVSDIMNIYRHKMSLPVSGISLTFTLLSIYTVFNYSYVWDVYKPLMATNYVSKLILSSLLPDDDD